MHLPDRYKPILEFSNWIFNINPAYYYLPSFSGFFIVKPFKGTEECELLFYPKRGVLLSFGRKTTKEDCALLAASWCLQMDQNRFLPSSTDETENEKLKRRSKKKKQGGKKDSLTELANFVESDLFLSKLASEKKIASSGAQSTSLAIFEEMKNGTEKKLIFHFEKSSYLLLYKKIRTEVELRIQQLSGEQNPRILLGTYTGSPIYVVSALRDVPQILDVISYSYFRFPTRVVWG